MRELHVDCRAARRTGIGLKIERFHARDRPHGRSPVIGKIRSAEIPFIRGHQKHHHPDKVTARRPHGLIIRSHSRQR